MGDPGLLDELHRLQAELLTETCRSLLHHDDRCYTAAELDGDYGSHQALLEKLCAQGINLEDI